MNQISLEDAIRDYTGCIMDYRGATILVSKIEPGFIATVYNLADLKLHRIPFSVDEFRPVKRRLGYVNFGSVAAYIFRRPARCLKISLHPDNIGIEWGAFNYLEGEKKAIRTEVQDLRTSALLPTFDNQYPSFTSCIQDVKAKKARLLAFDRQFAVSYKNGVYYKGNLAGVWDEKNPTLDGVKFDQGYEYLKEIIHFPSYSSM